MERLPDEVRNKLRAPLPEEAIKPHPSKPYLSTIKAIYVTERFNDVFGINGWSTKTHLLEWFERKTPKDKTEYTAVLKTTITIPLFGIKHECIASSTNEDLGDAAKGATTDAITKIGSYLEVGIDVFKGKGSKPTAKPTPTPAKSPKSTKPLELKVTKMEELTPTHKSWDYAKRRIEQGVTLEQIRQTFVVSEDNAKLLCQNQEQKTTSNAVKA